MAPLRNEQDHLLYFEAQQAQNAQWADRIGMKLASIFRPGLSVLDFGCGHGALATQAAELGADVLGIDINPDRIAFAARHAARTSLHLASRLAFRCCAVESVPGANRFDAIISKDTFEHVAEIDSVLLAFRRLLKPDGRLYLGFSPLWFSPFGDHGFLTKRRIPWLHLALGERRFLVAHNAHTGRPDGSIEQAGFNRLTPQDFRAAFARHGFVPERARINPGSMLKRLAFLPLNLARCIPPLEPAATVGMYLTLRPEATL
jgi:SAM-dependent methyltransferase